MPEVLQKILRSHGFEREFSVFGARVAKWGVFGRGLSGYAKLFIGPGAQVDLVAALAAEGAKLVAGHKNAGAFAGRAFHDGGSGVVSAHGVDVSQLKNTKDSKKMSRDLRLIVLVVGLRCIGSVSGAQSEFKRRILGAGLGLAAAFHIDILLFF